MASGAAWPPSKFRFAVQFEDDRPAYFQEVSGLEGDAQAMETHYRSDRSSHPKTPRQRRFGNATIRRGILAGDSKLLKWCRQEPAMTVQRRDVTIQLLDESGQRTMAWTLVNAWPTRFTAPSAGGDGEIAVEEIELAFESISRQ